MILPLSRFEAVLLLRERRLLIMLLSIAAAVLLSSIAIAVDTARANSSKQAIAQDERERWLTQDPKDPHSAAHDSVYVFKLAPALAVLDPGIEPFVGQTVWLEAHAQNDMLHRPKGDATPLERAGLLSPATLLTMLAPLAAFVLGFSAIARERERGVLRMTLGAALEPRSVLLSRALVNWGVMVALFLAPCIAIGFLFALLQGVLDVDLLLRGLAWIAAIALYFALLVLIGLAIPVLCENSRMALVLLFGAWALFALALPRSLSNAAEAAVALPSTSEVRAQLQKEAPAYWSAEVSKERRVELLSKYGVQRVEDLPINERGAQLDIAERHSHQVFDRVLGSFYDRVEAQDAFFSRLSLLSPTAAVQQLSQQLAGTDFVHHRAFIEQAEAYRRDLVNRMNEEVMTHVVAAGERHIAGRSLWESIQPFEFRPLDLKSVSERAAVAFAALAGWSGLALAAFLLAVARLRP
jgi:ABC-2 type transport system permease protein